MTKIIIYNNIIPFKGYVAIGLWPFIFVRSSRKGKLSPITENHEMIHLRQQVEMLVIFFLIWYGLEWLFRFVQYGNAGKAYRNVSFEREAYGNEGDFEYLKSRKAFSWVSHL